MVTSSILRLSIHLTSACSLSCSALLSAWPSYSCCSSAPPGCLDWWRSMVTWWPSTTCLPSSAACRWARAPAHLSTSFVAFLVTCVTNLVCTLHRLQGVFIFFFHVVFNKDVRKNLKNVLTGKKNIPDDSSTTRASLLTVSQLLPGVKKGLRLFLYYFRLWYHILYLLYSTNLKTNLFNDTFYWIYFVGSPLLFPVSDNYCFWFW